MQENACSSINFVRNRRRERKKDREKDKTNKMGQMLQVLSGYSSHYNITFIFQRMSRHSRTFSNCAVWLLDSFFVIPPASWKDFESKKDPFFDPLNMLNGFPPPLSP